MSTTKVKVTPYRKVKIELIVRNPEQPRTYFDPAKLEELEESIREHGVIKPLAVEACGDSFILHDGERRLRAAKQAGLKRVPVVIVPPLNGTGPRERLERAIVANVQHAEMHAIEEGLGYQRLITEFGYSLAQLSKRVGKHYTRIAFCLDLLKLDPEIRQLMIERRLPSDTKMKDALLSVEDRADRIKLATALAGRKATSKMIVSACHRFNLAKGVAKRKAKKESPAVRLTQENLPEWDALYQLGKVPPWPVVTESVMATCDACPLRKMASDATCGDCPVVVCVKNMLEAVHGNTKR